MPLSGLSTGKDITLALITPSGALTIGGISAFKFQRVSSTLKSKQLGGKNIYAYETEGYEGSFEIERVDSSVDDYFAAVDALYYNGGDIGFSTITQTMTEKGGSVTQYRFQGVVFDLSDGGNYVSGQLVKQSVKFMASERVKVQ